MFDSARHRNVLMNDFGLLATLRLYTNCMYSVPYFSEYHKLDKCNTSCITRIIIVEASLFMFASIESGSLK